MPTPPFDSGWIDLPAHNAYIETTEDRVSVVGTHGLETLANEDTDNYIRFDKDTASGSGNGWAFRVGRGGSMLGFGLLDLSTLPFSSVTITDVRFVMKARLPSGAGGDIPDNGGGVYGDGAYDSATTNVPVHRWPMVMLDYQGGPYFSGYNFSAIRTDGAWDDLVCDVQLAHVLPSLVGGSADYVIGGVGTPDTGTFGLCPRVQIDGFYPWPNVSFVDDVPVDIAYLAIRVTYVPLIVNTPLRRYPPVNNGGSGPTRHWPRTVNRRAGGTY